MEPRSPSLRVDYLPTEPHHYQFSLVAQSCPTLCDPRDCIKPGFPVHHQLLELTQTHVHWVSDAFQPSHPLLSPSPLAFNFYQHQGLFQWVSYTHQVVKVLEFQHHISSFNKYSGLISSRDGLVGSPCCPRVFSNTTVQKHQFFSTQLSLQSNSHIHTWLLEKPKLWLDEPLLAK